MANYVAIKDGLVVNVLEAKTKKIAEDASGCSCVEYDYSVNPAIGWTYEDGVFIAPEVIDEPEAL